MSRVEKLKTLLARVEERKKQPRLRAVPAAFAPAEPSNEPAPRVAAPVAAAPVAAVSAPAAPAPAAPAFATQAGGPARPPAPSPLEDALAELAPAAQSAGGILPTPIPTGFDVSQELILEDTEPGSVPPSPFRSRQPARATEQIRPSEPVRSRTPSPSLADPFADDPFAASLRPPAPSLRPAAPSFAPPAPSMPPAAPTLPPAVTMAPSAASFAPPAITVSEPEPVLLTAPSGRITADLPLNTAPVVTSTSALRVEPKRSFGELLERTLALRPRE